MNTCLTRRELALGAGAVLGRVSAAVQNLDLSDIPNFCSHEHWGSIDSIGTVAEGFRADVEQGARPRGATGIVDLVLDPYLRGNLSAAGSKISIPDLKKMRAVDAFESLRLVLDPHRLTGTYQCTRRGIEFLYGMDLQNLKSAYVTSLDNAIGRNYARHLDWYRTAMEKARFSELIRPVHPEFYVRQDSPEQAAAEMSFTRTVMRIDPLLELWRESDRKKKLADMTGTSPADAASWRAFLTKLFDLAAGKGAAGIKQLQAYRRDLDFRPRADGDVVWTGELTAVQVRIFQDWVVQECCKQAHERRWAQQIHVGTHNITQSSPMPLLELARRYPAMKIVMIHCWPFLKEAGWLMKYQSNMYADTCWQPILNPDFLRDAIGSWLMYVPRHKITCGHDATTVEMAAGSALFTREILADSLTRVRTELGASEREVRKIAADFLHNNAVEIYGIGKRFVI